ncbi:unnamed protein product [Notodromas monacha]|uniref:Major facilitator superfamily (MFS) profile domain-containing protein n=1 Tax=Notodromas monacha TaxID=399045 RepID=A0A7R9BZQ6_9CRUS|nr:unnamed protein product [Notodromas monacha]CAG0924650.1 unnamed protein product [Notodromas monacha]
MMDKIGRKRCIAISGIVMAVSQAGLGVYSFCEATPGLEHFVVQYNWMPVALLTITQVGFNFCMATLVFVLVGEIIPVQIKNYVSGFLNAAIECTNSAALESFHYMVMDLGMHGTLWVYSGMCLFVVVFLNLTLTETSGKTLREIERKMTNLKPLPIPAENKFAKY